MPEKPKNILVCTAWPYANGSLHLGHIAGCYLPADIFARYNRLKGNNVVMVSGSDAHGTPVTITAESQGITPEQVSDHYHKEFLFDWQRLGINYDNFTSTHTENHVKVVQDIFLDLYNKKFIYKNIMSQPYCEDHQRYLADRYVEGICPHCRFDNARGDQCDNCGNTLDPKDLINIRHKDCNTSPVFRDTEHFFLKLSSFEDDLLQWVNKNNHWKSNVKNFTIGFLEGGLIDRAITRDIDWGIPIPIKGYENKRIYVWFEAVIGYLSATIEWAQKNNSPVEWKEFWENESQSYYFMGKDNIPFHTVIWPAILMGKENLNLPYDVPANEYVNMESKKISTSRNWVVNVKDYLERYDPDPLRFALTSIMPETSDSNFSWEQYLRLNNDELVATFGNLVHRVISMTHRYFNGIVQPPVNLDEKDKALIKFAENTLVEVGNQISLCKFRKGLSLALSLAQETNKYIDSKAPWKSYQTDPTITGTSLYICINIINCLKIMFIPYLPFTTERLHADLLLEGNVTDNGWTWNPEAIIPGHKLAAPHPLFLKLDESIIEEEVKRLGIN
jgi:methionyl-tRNA synthetase